MTDQGNILVLVEMDQDRVSDLSLEMLGCARHLAGKNDNRDVIAVVFGHGLGTLGEDLISFGANKVILFEDNLCLPYQADAWLPDIAAIAKETKAGLVLMGHNSTGGDLAPRLAFQLKCGIATSCEKITIEGTKTFLTRTCYGGKAREVLSFDNEVAIATIRPKSQTPIARDIERRGGIETKPLSIKENDVRVNVVERKYVESDGPKLENASIIVAGGGGLGGPKGFEIAAELAGMLGGAVGASRVACDQGWCPPGYQIGLSGKTVAPELYIAIGISGASHHMAGCANAKNIVAINNDSDAPMFKFSRYGAIGDYEELLPALTKQIAKLKE